jgi:membrane protein implicated in regulation of membrane protease activity
MNQPFSFLFHSSIYVQLISLLPHTFLFMAGALLGYFSWVGLGIGMLAGGFLGVRFWAETREPHTRQGQFPITDSQKAGYLVVFYLYAVFLGCVIDRVSAAPGSGLVESFLSLSLYGSLGLLMTFTLAQFARLCWFSLRGRWMLDRFLNRGRHAGPGRLAGLTGVVTERVAPQGKIRIRGELWNAESVEGEALPPGSRVTVVDVEGLTLRVRPRPSQVLDRS